MKKRMLALLLAMVLTLGLLPAAALAAGSGEITVYASVVKNGEFVKGKEGETIVYVPVTVSAETLTIGDAFTALHETYYEGGTAGYALSGEMVSTFWGESALYAGYRNNDIYAMGATDAIVDGDYLCFWFYQDTVSWSDSYTHFDRNTAEVNGGVGLTLTLTAAGYPSSAPLAGAQLTVDGQPVPGKTTGEAGEVTLHFPQAGTYVVSAQSEGYIVPPVCIVTVTGDDANITDAITGDLEALTLSETATENLTLPSVGASGKTSITWTSSNPDAISNAGVVTRGDTEQQVTMTATIAYGGQSDTKDFSVTVPAMADEALLNVAKAALEAAAPITPSQWNEDYTAAGDTNIIPVVQKVVDSAASGVTVKNTVISANPELVAENGDITYKNKANTFNVTLTLAKGGKEMPVTVEVTIPRAAQTRQSVMDQAAQDLGTAIRKNNSSLDNIITDLNLTSLTSVLGMYVQVEWSIPAEGCLDRYGKVTRPIYGQEDKTFTIQGTLSWYSAMEGAMPSGYVGPTPKDVVKEYSLTIKAITEEEVNEAKAEVDAALESFDVKNIEYFYDSALPVDLTGVTGTLTLPGVSGFTSATAWTTGNAAVIEAPAYKTGKAVVHRPAVGAESAVCEVTLTLSKHGYSASKSFSITVLPMTQAEIDAETVAMNAVEKALGFSVIKKDNTLPSQVTDNLQMVYRGIYDANTDTVTWKTVNKGYEGFEITWATSDENVVQTYGTVKRPVADTTVTLTATLTSFRLNEFLPSRTVEIPITVLASGKATLLEGIAAGYVDSGNDWEVLAGMAAYAAMNPSTVNKTSQTAKQSYINAAIGAVNANEPTDQACATAIIGLQAIGADPRILYPVNSSTAISAVDKLNAATQSAKVWNAVYTLLAYQQGDFGGESYEQALIAKVLANQQENGSWTDYSMTADSTANAILGLAAHYDTDASVKTAIDKAVNYLSTAQKANGAFDGGYGANTNSTAVVIMALAALGIDPDSDPRFVKEGNSALDGLLTFALEDNSGFGNMDNREKNALATKQGFSALIAAQQVMNAGTAYNVYDFSANPVTPARATPEQGGGEGGGGGDTPGGETMNVSFTLKTHNATWIPKYTLSVEKDATVGDAFKTAMKDRTGFSYVDDNGYISSITNNGATLAEFTHGNNSGWKYMVNGVACGVGINSKTLAAGDDLVWYYVTDYTTDTDRDEGSFTPAKPTNPETSQEGEQTVVEVKPSATTDKNGEAKATLTDKELTAALDSAKKGDAEALVLTPQITGAASAVTVELSALSAAAIAKEGMDVRVDTGLASVRLNAESLGELGAGSGKKVSITARAGENGSLTLEVRAGDDAVKTLAGGLTVALPVEKAAPGAVLVLVGEDGGETVVKLSAAQGNVLTARLNGSATVKVVDNAKTFEDVPQGHWAADATAFVTSRELLKGTGEGTFAPGAAMTRASLMTILYRLEGQEEPAVPAGQPWYAPAQSWAVDKGLSDGANPDGEMTRQELATLLYRYAGAKAEAESLTAPDGQSVAPWATEAMSWATAEGILTGDHNGLLNPAGAASRAEVSVMLERFVKTLLK